ncbi:ABC transporter related protein [Candidatus Vecturithrix granuli]|uniref:ABC transporter related protein n=1 Tax=Vecturithrix granuli TaxID=1499967 RepID=A0A081C2Z7_VECG1|nr:ABC transporter related protein [Candidatus Vecturithrix granuli]
MLQQEVVRLENIVKSFPGVKALQNVHLCVQAGEIHGLVGENGAGKSTLIKILMGVYQRDAGEIYIQGQKVEIKDPIQAKEYGLGAVYQDVTLAQHLSVGENFFLGRLPRTNLGLIDWKTVYQVTQETLEELNLHIDPRTLVKDLPTAEQEMIAIAKTVHDKSKLIIFDEPTALLTNEETEELFQLIGKLKADGLGIIYISHRLEEIFEICDTVTVLRDGVWVNSLPTAETDEDALIRMMVGRTIEEMYAIQHVERGEKALEVKNLTKRGRFENITFDLYKGEILGLFGLVGSGRTDIVKCIFGAEEYTAGEIWIGGKKTTITSPVEGIQHGIGLLPEDRKGQGLALSLSVTINVNLASYEEISRLNFVDLRQEKARAEQYVSSLQIKTPSIQQRVINLSGGNQQKIVIARWLCRASEVLIFDEPTVGVDVGAKVEIYKLIEELLQQHYAIIMISSYLPEIIGISDRLLVIHEGQITGMLNRSEYNEEKILKLASGILN